MAMEFGTYGADVGRSRRTDWLPVVRSVRRSASRMLGIVDVVVTAVSKEYTNSVRIQTRKNLYIP